VTALGAVLAAAGLIVALLRRRSPGAHRR
jgi:hypothetical protein